jgi:hypothetical protein
VDSLTCGSRRNFLRAVGAAGCDGWKDRQIHSYAREHCWCPVGLQNATSSRRPSVLPTYTSSATRKSGLVVRNRAFTPLGIPQSGNPPSYRFVLRISSVKRRCRQLFRYSWIVGDTEVTRFGPANLRVARNPEATQNEHFSEVPTTRSSRPFPGLATTGLQNGFCASFGQTA